MTGIQLQRLNTKRVQRVLIPSEYITLYVQEIINKSPGISIGAIAKYVKFTECIIGRVKHENILFKMDVGSVYVVYDKREAFDLC